MLGWTASAAACQLSQNTNCLVPYYPVPQRLAPSMELPPYTPLPLPSPPVETSQSRPTELPYEPSKPTLPEPYRYRRPLEPLDIPSYTHEMQHPDYLFPNRLYNDSQE
jgi:hypothetical protein